MAAIAEELQKVADNAEKCINYPIGDKLDEFFKSENETNFVLGGVIIYAASRIYGRKVDYLEQEIIGMAKNFRDVGMTDENSDKKTAETKKTRTKKFVIKDSVNIRKITFEEKPIVESNKDDINKSLNEPCKVNLLMKMKEFFSKNRSKTGKTVIPKKLLFTSDLITPNFGATQIYDYDDHREIVGSRKDFTCFSYFINNHTGELQNEVNFSLQIRIDEDSSMQPFLSLENIFSPNFSRPATPNDRIQSPFDWMSPPRSPSMTRGESVEKEVVDYQDQELIKRNEELRKAEEKDNENNLENMNIDEGIDMVEDDLDKDRFLLSPCESMFKSIGLLPAFPELPKTAETNEDFVLPLSIREEVETMKIMNIFMIPLKKLKHKCTFDLPNDEYGELKKMRKSLGKVAENSTVKQTRVFNPYDLINASLNNFCDDEPDFLGFTKEQQNEDSTFISFSNITNETIDMNVSKPLDETQNDISRKISNDSGFEENCSAELSLSSIDQTGQSCSHRNSIDLDESHAEPLDINININDDLESHHNFSVNKGDSCYQSLASGESSKTELSAFFQNLESRNRIIDEQEEIKDQIDEETLKQSEERISFMQQTAVNVAKWKEYLKPILAGSESRSKVDIKECASKIIHKIGEVNNTKSFSEITETSKTPIFFLTMLQLINNKNITMEHPERTMNEPVDMKNIKITLKSKALHQEKFDELGQQFENEEQNKKTVVTNLKRKIGQTSTPSCSTPNKRKSFGLSESSINFNESQSMIMNDSNVLSQSSSGYYSQSSTFSDL